MEKADFMKEIVERRKALLQQLVQARQNFETAKAHINAITGALSEIDGWLAGEDESSRKVGPGKGVGGSNAAASVKSRKKRGQK